MIRQILSLSLGFFVSSGLSATQKTELHYYQPPETRIHKLIECDVAVYRAMQTKEAFQDIYNAPTKAEFKLGSKLGIAGQGDRG